MRCRALFFTSVLCLIVTGARAPAETAAEVWATAQRNADAAHEALERCVHLVRAWYDHAGKNNALLPQNLKSRVWTPENSAADLWSFFVLTAHVTGSPELEALVRRTLRDEIRLTTRLDRLPDHYNIDGDGGFAHRTLELSRVIFGASEYVKDGILPIVELSGDAAFFDRGRALLEDIVKHAPVETRFGRIPSESAEVNGEMLQSLCRYYAATGDARYKQWAERIGDAYLLEMLPKNNGLPCHSWDFAAGQPRRDVLSLNDHGNEIIGGLAELLMMEHGCDPQRFDAYAPAMRILLDRLLGGAVNEDGLWYQMLRPSDGEILDRRTPDTWGYALSAVYAFHQMTGDARYRAAVERALRGINNGDKYTHWDGADSFADSIEGCIVLLNRVREPQAEAWLARVVPIFLAKQRSDGIVEGWHGDGNYARTALMYALMKTGGTRLGRWDPGVRYGAAIDGDAICVWLSSAAAWRGKLRFDHARHRDHFGLQINYPRLNEFPEWYTVEPTRLYEVQVDGQDSQQLLGADLIDGLLLEVGAAPVRVTVRPAAGPPYGPTAPRDAPPRLTDRLLLQVEDFDGPWRRQTNIGGYVGTGFCTSNANPNVADTRMSQEITADAAGRYVVWVRAYTSPGGRRAVQVQVGESRLAKTHTQDDRGWSWQRASEVDLSAGPVRIVIHDADVGYETADAVLITNRTDDDPEAEERRWLVFAEPLPPQADALRFNIDACCAMLERREVPASQAAWESAAPRLRRELAGALGLDPLPARTPLNARIMGRAERDGYTIENVVFESRPDFHVTANLYIPKHVGLPAPAVVVVPGHAMLDGKNYPEYQTAQLGLVQQGFVVLSYDPIGQGERRRPGFGHHLGYGLLLVGQTNEGMIIWDTMRALDYLTSRPEVDATRLGIAGNSGGGENTFYTTPLEPRLTAAAAFGFVCSYEQWLRFGGGHCICNHLPGIVQYMEEFEIVGLSAPRPFLIGNGSKDAIFPIAGTRETYRRAGQLYTLFEVSERIRLVEAPFPHAWVQPLREACYGWMNRWLAGRGDGSPVAEASIEPQPWNAPDLLCFKDGGWPGRARSIVDLNRERAEQLRRAYADPPATAEQWRCRAPAWRAEVWELFGGRPEDTRPAARRVRSFEWRNTRVDVLAIETEPGMEIAATYFHPAAAKTPAPAVIYLDERDKSRAKDDPRVIELIDRGVAVLALDPRGLGEASVNENQLTSDSVCLGRHIFAQRVWDVLQAARLLSQTDGIDPKRIGCHGRRAGGLLALFAAALEAPFEHIEVERPLAGYRFFFENTQPQPIWLAVPNLLRVIDVPQVVALASPTRVRIVEPVGYGREPLEAQAAQDELAFARSLYQLMNADDALEIVAPPDAE